MGITHYNTDKYKVLKYEDFLITEPFQFEFAFIKYSKLNPYLWSSKYNSFEQSLNINLSSQSNMIIWKKKMHNSSTFFNKDRGWEDDMKLYTKYGYCRINKEEHYYLQKAKERDNENMIKNIKYHYIIFENLKIATLNTVNGLLRMYLTKNREDYYQKAFNLIKYYLNARSNEYLHFYLLYVIRMYWLKIGLYSNIYLHYPGGTSKPYIMKEYSQYKYEFLKEKPFDKYGQPIPDNKISKITYFREKDNNYINIIKKYNINMDNIISITKSWNNYKGKHIVFISKKEYLETKLKKEESMKRTQTNSQEKPVQPAFKVGMNKKDRRLYHEEYEKYQSQIKQKIYTIYHANGSILRLRANSPKHAMNSCKYPYNKIVKVMLGDDIIFKRNLNKTKKKKSNKRIQITNQISDRKICIAKKDINGITIEVKRIWKSEFDNYKSEWVYTNKSSYKSFTRNDNKESFPQSIILNPEKKGKKFAHRIEKETNKAKKVIQKRENSTLERRLKGLKTLTIFYTDSETNKVVKYKYRGGKRKKNKKTHVAKDKQRRTSRRKNNQKNSLVRRE